MRPSFLTWSLVVLVGLFLLIIGPATILHRIEGPGMVYPTPDTQSEFFKTYTPETVSLTFKLQDGLSVISEGGPSGAGHGFATYQHLMDLSFEISPQDRQAVTRAISSDLSARLVGSGAKIVATEHTAEGRTLFRYVCGQTQGEAVVEPLRIGYFSYPIPRKPPAGRLPVTASVNIQEKWFKPLPGTRF